MNVIAKIKKTSKVFYELDGKRMNIKQIFAVSKKRPGRSKYLLSVDVTLTDREENAIPARIVCGRNPDKCKDWIAFLSTDTSLDPEEKPCYCFALIFPSSSSNFISCMTRALSMPRDRSRRQMGA